jgi:ABC-type multidrug transport system ATPase subunit
MPNKHILEVDSVRKVYDTKLILSDFWLRCETGDVIGLLGRNGSGKSTLLKIIFGILPADFCFLRVDGKKQSGISQRIGWIGYLPQENFIPKHLRVAKAIRLSVDKAKQAEIFNDILIAALLDKKDAAMSGGELRYLEILLILYNESKFALLDEPFNGLSPIVAVRVSQAIQNCTHKGIIVTDHQYENIIAISNKLILMRDGNAHHLKSSPELADYDYLPK